MLWRCYSDVSSDRGGGSSCRFAGEVEAATVVTLAVFVVAR